MKLTWQWILELYSVTKFVVLDQGNAGLVRPPHSKARCPLITDAVWYSMSLFLAHNDFNGLDI